METRANYVAIGLFVVMVLVAALGSLMWLYRSSEPGQQAFIRVVFPEPVTGLSVGGSVLFNGIRVGEVTQLQWQPEGGDDVTALLRVTQNAPIKPDTEAKLSSQGLTGVSFISLTGGDPDAPPIFADVAPGQIPTLRAATSDFTSVLDSAQTVLARINTTLGEVNGLLRDNRENVNAVVANVRTLSDTLAESSPAIERLISDVASAGREAAETLPAVRRAVDRADTLLAAIPPQDIRQIVGDASEFAGTLPGIGQQAETIVGNVGGVVNRLDGAVGTLSEALDGVRSVVAAVSPGVVGQLVDDAGVAARNIADLSGTLSDVRVDAAEAVRNANTLTENLAVASEGAPLIVENLNNRINEAGEVIRALDAEAINSLITSADQAAQGLAREVEKVGPLIASATDAAANIASVSQTVASRNEAIAITLDDVAATVADARRTVARLPGLVDELQPGVANLSQVLQSVDAEAVGRLVNDASAFVATLSENREAVAEIAQRVATAAARIDTITRVFELELPEISQFIDSARDFASNLNGIADQLRPGLANASEALSSIDPGLVGEVVDNVATFTSGLSDRTGTISQLVEDAGEFASGLASQTPSITDLVQSARDMAARLDGLTEEVSPQVSAIVESARQTLQAAQEFAQRLPGFGEKLEPGIENLTAVMTAIDSSAVQAIVNDTAKVANDLSGQMQPIADTIAAARGTAISAEVFATGIAQRTPQITAIIDDAQLGVTAAARIALDVEGTIARVRPDIESAAAAIAVLTPERVERLANDVQLVVDGVILQTTRFNNIMVNAQAITEDVRSVSSTVSERSGTIGVAVDQASEAIADLRIAAASVPQIVADVQPGVENLGNVLEAIDSEAVRSVVDNINSISAAIAAEAPQIRTIMDNLTVTSSDVRQISTVVRAELGTITNILGNADAAVADARLFAAGLPLLLSDLAPGVDNLSSTLQSIDPQAIRAIVTDLQETLSAVAANREAIASTIGSAQRAAANVERVTDTVAARSASIGAAIDDTRSLTATLSEAAPQVRSTLTAIDETAQRLRATISAVDPAEVRAIVADVRAATRAVGERSEEIGEAIDNATAAAQSLSQALRGMNGDGGLSSVIERVNALVDSLQGASRNVSIVAERAAELFSGPVQSFVFEADNAATQVGNVAAAFASRADAIAGGLQRFSTAGLDDLRAVLTQGRTTLATIESTVSNIERNPSRIIFGGPDGPRYSPQRR